MLKVVESRRSAVAVARILLVLTLFAIGLAPAAKADGLSYEYTMTFMPSGIDNLHMSISFVVPALGVPPNLDDVQVTQRPTIFAPVVVTGNAPPSSWNDYSYLPVEPSLVSVNVSSDGVSANFWYQVPCNPGDESVCAPNNGVPNGIPYRWQAEVSYALVFDSPITGPGSPSPIHTEVDETTNGNGPLGESHNNLSGRDPADTLNVVATPEPTTGLLVGACFLCCAMIALLRRGA